MWGYTLIQFGFKGKTFIRKLIDGGIQTISMKKRVIMEKENESKRTKDTRDSPPEGKIARLRYRRRHPHLYRHPQIKPRHYLNQDIVTTPLQHGGKSAV